MRWRHAHGGRSGQCSWVTVGQRLAVGWSHPHPQQHPDGLQGITPCGQLSSQAPPAACGQLLSQAPPAACGQLPSQAPPAARPPHPADVHLSSPRKARSPRPGSGRRLASDLLQPPSLHAVERTKERSRSRLPAPPPLPLQPQLSLCPMTHRPCSTGCPGSPHCLAPRCPGPPPCLAHGRPHLLQAAPSQTSRARWEAACPKGVMRHSQA